MQSCHNISSTPQSCVFNRNGLPNFPSVILTFLFLSSCLLPHFYLPLSRLFSRLIIAFRPSLAISTNAYEESRHGVRLFWCARKKAGAREIRRKGGDETRENCCPGQPEIAAGSVIRSSTVQRELTSKVERSREQAERRARGQDSVGCRSAQPISNSPGIFCRARLFSAFNARLYATART